MKAASPLLTPPSDIAVVSSFVAAPPVEIVTSINLVNHRRNNLDFLRLFFAVTVIYCHSYALVGGASAKYIPPWGMQALGFFFTISGFLVTGSYLSSRSTRSYLKKRALRIFPGYVAAVVFCLIVVVPLDSSGLTFFEIVKLVLGAAVLEPMESAKIFAHNPMPGSLDGPMWTIRYEFGCYILVIILGWAGILKRPKLAPWLILAITIVALAPHLTVHIRRRFFFFGSWSAWCMFGRMFLIGVNAFLWRRHIVIRPIYAVIALLVATGATYIPVEEISSLIRDLSTAYIMYCIAFADWLPLHQFGKIGDLSYGTYLYGWPAEQLLIKYTGNSLSPLVAFVFATLIALALGFLSWHLIERPFLRLKTRHQASLVASTA